MPQDNTCEARACTTPNAGISAVRILKLNNNSNRDRLLAYNLLINRTLII